MDVTEPSSPEEVVMSILDDLLREDDEEIDTQVYADNITRGLRDAGFLEALEGDAPIPAPSGFGRPAPSGFGRRIGSGGGGAARD